MASGSRCNPSCPDRRDSNRLAAVARGTQNRVKTVLWICVAQCVCGALSDSVVALRKSLLKNANAFFAIGLAKQPGGVIIKPPHVTCNCADRSICTDAFGSHRRPPSEWQDRRPTTGLQHGQSRRPRGSAQAIAPPSRVLAESSSASAFDRRSTASSTRSLPRASAAAARISASLGMDTQSVPFNADLYRDAQEWEDELREQRQQLLAHHQEATDAIERSQQAQYDDEHDEDPRCAGFVEQHERDSCETPASARRNPGSHHGRQRCARARRCNYRGTSSRLIIRGATAGNSWKNDFRGTPFKSTTHGEHL